MRQSRRGLYFPFGALGVTKSRGRTITFALQDNDAFDRDPTVGVIRDPVRIVTYTRGGGGGCVLSSDSNRDLSMLLICAAIVLIGGWRRYTRR